MAQSWYVWTFNMKNIRVYTAEALLKAQVRIDNSLMRTIEVTSDAVNS